MLWFCRYSLVRQSGSALPFLTLSSKLWSGSWCLVDGLRWKWGMEKREGICAYHTPLSSRWQESARSFVGERPCIQRGEERIERSSCRMVEGSEREKKLMPARHPQLQRLLYFSQWFHCTKHWFIGFCAMYMLCFYVGSKGLCVWVMLLALASG